MRDVPFPSNPPPILLSIAVPNPLMGHTWFGLRGSTTPHTDPAVGLSLRLQGGKLSPTCLAGWADRLAKAVMAGVVPAGRGSRIRSGFPMCCKHPLPGIDEDLD